MILPSIQVILTRTASREIRDFWNQHSEPYAMMIGQPVLTRSGEDRCVLRLAYLTPAQAKRMNAALDAIKGVA